MSQPEQALAPEDMARQIGVDITRLSKKIVEGKVPERALLRNHFLPILGKVALLAEWAATTATAAASDAERALALVGIDILTSVVEEALEALDSALEAIPAKHPARALVEEAATALREGLSLVDEDDEDDEDASNDADGDDADGDDANTSGGDDADAGT